ncbi:kinase-like protein, partial [Fomitiporia mediterranea MF3/22]|uniref:kinase-like protein n=1 Tax=Fomitiporia mediterranea (strain MF3/22) TaxID=694068 RepID=UPI0004409476
LNRELIEGIAFLHRQKIAHLDIKPENLVYSVKSERLYIIDFDIAMRCKDVDEMVKVSCGTPGWSAPEIALNNDEAPRVFNPIRADLWSCGKVLK